MKIAAETGLVPAYAHDSGHGLNDQSDHSLPHGRELNLDYTGR